MRDTWSQHAQQLLLSPPKDDYWLRLCRCGLLWPAALTHNKRNVAIPDKVAWCIRPLLSWHSPYLPCRAKVFQAKGRVTAIRHCSKQSPLAVSLPPTAPWGEGWTLCADPVVQQQGLFTSSVNIIDPKVKCAYDTWQHLEAMFPTFDIKVNQFSLVFPLPF